MKKKYLALILAMTMTGGIFTGCGDGEDDSSDTGTAAVSSEADDEDTSEASTEKGEKASGVVVRTTSADTTETSTEPASDGDISGSQLPAEITLDVTDMIGMHPGEIAQLFGGEFELESDAILGHYCMHNYDILPDVKFYFEDHTWDDMWKGLNLREADYDQLHDNVTSSRQPVDKINRYSGVQDEFRIGMRYKECADIIGDFPTMAGDSGETMIGCPGSLVYQYLCDYNKNCVVALHFELAGELDSRLNEGVLTYPGTSDVTPAVMSQYDPALKVVTVLYAPQIKTSPMIASATSTLPDITSGGKRYSYSPNHLIDGDLATCWCEGASDTGIDQKITIRNNDLKKCQFITVYGGLMSGEEGFYKNCRPAVLEIEPEGVVGMGYIMMTEYSTKYKRAIPVGYISDETYDFIIKEVDSSRSEYSDTCISEIEFNG